MYCRFCGKELPEIGEFCPFCGKPKMNQTSATTQVDAPLQEIQQPSWLAKNHNNLCQVLLGLLLLFWVVTPAFFESAQRDLFTLGVDNYILATLIHSNVSFLQALLGGITALSMLTGGLLFGRYSAGITMAKITAAFHGLFAALIGIVVTLMKVAPATLLGFIEGYSSSSENAAEFLQSPEALDAVFGPVDWARLVVSLVMILVLLVTVRYFKPNKVRLGKPLSGLVLWCSLWPACACLFKLLLQPIKSNALSKEDYTNFAVADTAYEYLFDLVWLIPVLLPALVYVFRHSDAKKLYLIGVLAMAGWFLVDVFVGEYSITYLQSPSFGAREWGQVSQYLLLRAVYAFAYCALLLAWLMATAKERVPFWLMSAYIGVGGVIHWAVSLFWYRALNGGDTPGGLMIPEFISLALLVVLSVVALLVCRRKKKNETPAEPVMLQS